MILFENWTVIENKNFFVNKSTLKVDLWNFWPTQKIDLPDRWFSYIEYAQGENLPICYIWKNWNLLEIRSILNALVYSRTHLLSDILRMLRLSITKVDLLKKWYILKEDLRKR